MTNKQTDLFSMTGQVVLVTGASSGLGNHFARVLAGAGADVAVAARRVDRLEPLVQELEAGGTKAFATAMDVTSASSINTALDAIEKELGTVTVLINNAGVADSRYCLKVDEDSWDFVMNTNLKGAWQIARMMAERCIKAGNAGSIVNIASILALRVGFGESTYATSKAALVQLTKSMALELGAKNVRVNAICPGYFSTEMNDSFLASEAGQEMLKKGAFGRAGNLPELNGPLLMLSSNAGSFITGSAIPVDGGHLLSSL